MFFSIQKLFAMVLVTGCMMLVANAAEGQQRRPCGPSFIPAPLRIFIPQRAGGADLRPACRNHDQCYSGQRGLSRDECDQNFLQDMLSQCDCARNPKKCQRKAWMYYNLAKKFGESSFQK